MSRDNSKIMKTVSLAPLGIVWFVDSAGFEYEIQPFGPPFIKAELKLIIQLFYLPMFVLHSKHKDFI